MAKSSKRDIIAKSPPKSTSIGMTRRCNLSCLMCLYNESRDDTSMPLDLFRKIEEELFNRVNCVFLCGAGEPLLYDNLFEVFDILSSYNFRWGWSFVTNGLLINDEIAKKIVTGNCREIVISIDGATEETYRLVRAFGKIDKDNITLSRVLSNLDKINYFKKKLGRQNPKIFFNFIAMDFNIDEFPLLVKIAHKYNVSRIRPVRLASRERDPWRKYFIDLRSPKSSKIFKTAKNLGDELGVEINFELTEGFICRNEPCFKPWEWFNIAVDGEFRPCSWIEKKYNGFEVGNLHRQSFMEVWNNEKMQELREGILDGTYAFCKKYASANCTHLTENE